MILRRGVDQIKLQWTWSRMEGRWWLPQSQIISARKLIEVEIQIKMLLYDSESLYGSNVGLLQSSQKCMREQMNNRLKDIASASVNTYPPGKKFKHTFCETDEHGFNECEAKELCAYFGLDNHCSQKCFWMGNTCSFCKVQGHPSKLHQVTDQNIQTHNHEYPWSREVLSLLGHWKAASSRSPICGSYWSTERWWEGQCWG